MSVERGRIVNVGDFEWGRGVVMRVSEPAGEVRLFAPAALCRDLGSNLFRFAYLTVEAREVVSFYTLNEGP